MYIVLKLSTLFIFLIIKIKYKMHRCLYLYSNQLKLVISYKYYIVLDCIFEYL